MALRSLHIPAPPSLWIHGTGLMVVVLYCAASAVFNHTRLGDAARELPFAVFVGLHLTFAIAPAGGILGHLATRRPAALAWLGLGIGARDLSAALAALTLGCVIAGFSLSGGSPSGSTGGPGVPGGFDEALRLFANLLVASTAEALVCLGVAANLVLLALRERWKNPPAKGPEAVAALVSTMLLCALHLSHAPPLDGLDNALLLAFAWIAASAIFVLTRSLLAAILFSNMMSLIQVVQSEVQIEATTQHGVGLLAVAVSLFTAALWLSGWRNVGWPNR